MTETRAAYTVSNKPDVKLWRCGHCQHILGSVVGGCCTIVHEVRLDNKSISVKCPACGCWEPWHWESRKE